MGGRLSRGKTENVAHQDEEKQNVQIESTPGKEEAEKQFEEGNEEDDKETNQECPLPQNDPNSGHAGLIKQENMESSNCTHEGFLALPPELVLQIFQHLSPRCLRHVVLTCRYFHQVASDPDLWTHMAIDKLKVKHCGLSDFYKIARFSKLKNLYLADVDIENGLFLSADILTEVLWYVHTRAMDGAHLESLDLTYAREMDELSTELVVTALTKVRCLDISATGLSQHQLEELLRKLPSSDIIEELTIGHDLGAEHCPEERKIDPNLVAEAFCSLKKVNADSTSMNTLQIIALFSRILTTDTLEHLNMYNSSLEEVPSQLINKAICKLRHIDIGYCIHGGYNETSQLKLTSLFTALSTSTMLQSINFYNANMSQIDPVIIARGVCQVPRVKMVYLKLTVGHLIEIARCKVMGKCNLMDLDISQNDFSELRDYELVGQAIGRMQKVNLEMCQLTEDQWSSIINVIQELGEERQLTWDNLIYS